jgi:prolyl-tRNA synthetase
MEDLRSPDKMHRWSQLFIPTLREAPADAEVASHKFLVRSGYIRQLGAGIYSYLFMGQRSILKIIDVIREEMNKIGQEFLLPAIHPREVWEQSGRWQLMGDNMFRLKDRKGADLCLGMTHEEVMTDIGAKSCAVTSASADLVPDTEQVQRRARPKSGLIRCGSSR